MEPYEGFTNNNDEPRPDGETPETVTEHTAPAESSAPAETPAAQKPQDAYAPPEQRRGAYADAGYIPAADAGAMPKSYPFAAASEPKAKEKAPRRGMRPVAVVALCVVCAMLGGLVAGLAPQWMVKSSAPETAAAETPVPVPTGSPDTVLNLSAGENTRTVTTNKVATEEMSASDIYYNRALDQVVTIRVEMTYSSFFGYQAKATGSGSGFIISDDGYILTNYHVIEGVEGNGEDVTVVTYDGTEYPATIIGYDEDHDVALLKIEATGLGAAILGDSDAMLVGENVYVVGNPTGELEYSMTEGIVSAKDREITAANSSTGRTETISVFQTTAAINGGNSGGPVYNSRGEVIGIVVAKRISTDIEGLAFAIPINDAVRIAQDLINDGYVRGKAYLGVRLGTVTASAAQYYGLVQGAIIGSVVEGSAAERAGLKESDIIVAIDDKEITTHDELINAKKNYSAGDTAVLRVYRESKYIDITVTFDEMKPETLDTEPAEAPEETPETPQQPENGKRYPNAPFGN